MGVMVWWRDLSRFGRGRGQAVFLFAEVVSRNVRQWHFTDIGLCAAHVCF